MEDNYNKIIGPGSIDAQSEFSADGKDKDYEDALRIINHPDKNKRSSTTRIESKSMLFTR